MQLLFSILNKKCFLYFLTFYNTFAPNYKTHLMKHNYSTNKVVTAALYTSQNKIQPLHLK